MMKKFLLRSVDVVAIAVSSAMLGIGIGFIQGEIVARTGAQDEQLVFAGTAGMVGGLVALFLGPVLYYSLKRRIALEQFCYVAALSLFVGVAASWLLSMRSNGPGWVSMFVTPLAAIFLAVSFARKKEMQG
jgi:hypothetical protein